MKLTDNIETGNRIKFLRERLKITQEELSLRVGISAGAMCQIENGKSGMSSKTFLKVVRELNTTAEYLSGEKKSDDDRDIEEINSLFAYFNDKNKKLAIELWRVIKKNQDNA